MRFGSGLIGRLVNAIPSRAPYLLIFAIIALLQSGGAMWHLDRLFVDAGFRINEREASKHLVLIQFDPKSIAALNTWPWPRSVHARAIEKLHKAGVVEIGYDVDFSSPANGDGDAELARVLAEVKSKVILPAFHQRSAVGSERLVIHETLPLPVFRQPAQLGNVVFRPAPDGLIREMAPVTPWHGGDVPAMSALLAGPAALNRGLFHIDFGIDVNSVPRFSLIDLLNDRIPDNALKGKKVIVGAAATELGDQHAVPVHGRLHGIEVQALAFESLVQNRTLQPVQPGVIVIALLLMTLAIGTRLEKLRWQIGGALALGATAGFISLTIAAQGFGSVIVPPTAFAMLIICFVIFAAYRDLSGKSKLVFRQRMSLVHQRAFIQEVLDNSFDGIIVCDTSGAVVAHNPAARRLLRQEDRDLNQDNLSDILPAEAEILFPHMNDLPGDRVSGEYEPMVVRFNPQDDKPYFLEFMPGRFSRKRSRFDILEVRKTDRVFFTFSFRDVSARIEREAQERAEKDRALEQSRAKSEVMASMSHELRTPLNAILGFSEIMKMESLGPLTATYRSYADGIHTSGEHLLTLIDEMLDVAQIEAGRFEISEVLFDVGKTLTQCMRIVDGWRDTKDRSLVLEIDDTLPLMMGSPRLISQCVINLLSNSIKYSDTGDSIAIRLFRDRSENLILEIEDSGSGIAEDKLELVTKPFYRVENIKTRSNQEGVGLGLSLVDAYVRAHEGSMSIKSRVGLGTTVRLTFPHSRLFDSHPVEDEDRAASATGSDATNVVEFRKDGGKDSSKV